MPVWKSFPQAPSCPLFRIYVSLMMHCAALLVRLRGLVLFGPLFFSLLTQFTSDSLGGHFLPSSFPQLGKDWSWNPGVIVYMDSSCNKIDLIQTSSVLQSQAPLSDIDFFDTHDILTIFHMMQYIAIFLRYFPSVNWPKILQNFIPGAHMLTFSRQNGLFTIT